MDAILVGIGTVLADNPSLTTRIPGVKGKNPIRVILDRNLHIPLDANVLNTDIADTIIVTSTNADPMKIAELEKRNVTMIYCTRVDEGLDLREVMEELYKRNITDVLLEGGSEINTSFLRAGLIDKFIVYIAPKVLGGRNSKTPFTGPDVDLIDESFPIEFDSVEKSGEDLCMIAYPKKGRPSCLIRKYVL